MYVAYGENAIAEAKLSIQSLRHVHPDMPILIVGETPIEGCDFHFLEDTDPSYRKAKLHANLTSPFDQTLYLDADARPMMDISVGFDILSDGWDLVIVPSANQGKEFLWHVNPEERAETKTALQGATLQLQGGVFWFGSTPQITAFFEAWRGEWEQYQGQDQGALLRALHKCPIRVWLLARPFNGGAVIQHRFGKAAGHVNNWRKPPRK